MNSADANQNDEATQTAVVLFGLQARFAFDLGDKESARLSTNARNKILIDRIESNPSYCDARLAAIEREHQTGNWGSSAAREFRK